LLAAHAAFETLGAAPWAARAATELAAAGARPTARPPARSLDPLTPQELQTARAVAAGQSNAEAAASLYLSRKTVEAHLSRIYRKLGIRSRTDLARIVGASRPEP
jgi:DNA-binding NarL/FixJ family response regulator